MVSVSVTVMNFAVVEVDRTVEAGVKQVGVSGRRDQGRDARPGGVGSVRPSRCLIAFRE